MTSRSIILTGPHVALAEMTADDQPHFLHWLSSNAELRAQVGDHTVPTHDTQLQWFARCQQPDRKMFSLVTVPDHTLIGHAGFVHIDPIAKTATFRITIGNTEHHGKGLGTEATRLALQYGFEELALESVFLKVVDTNARAMHMYKKVGFVPKGHVCEHHNQTMVLDRHSFLSTLS